MKISPKDKRPVASAQGLFSDRMVERWQVRSLSELYGFLIADAFKNHGDRVIEFSEFALPPLDSISEAVGSFALPPPMHQKQRDSELWINCERTCNLQHGCNMVIQG